MSVAPDKCPACGAEKEWVSVGYKKTGFSVGKAALGGILLGPIGLLGGALGSNMAHYYCTKCGYSAKYDYKAHKDD